MKKSIAIIITLLLGITLLAGCGKKEIEPQPSTKEQTSAQDTSVEINVTALKGPTGMGMAYLNQQSDDGNTAYKYTINYAGAPDEVVGGLISGEIDIAAVPVNLAATLFNKTNGEILTAAVNTLGVIYIVENGENVQSMADLAGKKIVASGQGSTPEYALNYLLEKNGLTGQVEVEYVSEHDEAVSALVAGKADLVMIPEPKVTAALSQLETARVAISLTDEWDKVSDTQMITGVLVVQKAFANEHPEILKDFLEEYKASVKFTNANPQEASQLIEKYGIIPKAPVALKALPNCNIVYIDGSEMAASVTAMLTTLFDANPASVGGKLPGEEMFYESHS
ncbi:MAG: ABC transporter substrate-binding protein [Lachnospiraceae bacterium]|nr:ABC transporter substrate-binding protein [Lachnospiraceae bacterium]